MPNQWTDLQHVDRTIHEPARLMILGILAVSEEADFVFLMNETGMTKGNLSSHLGKLEEAGYVRIEKSFRGRVPVTAAVITKPGRKAFLAYRKLILRAFEKGWEEQTA